MPDQPLAYFLTFTCHGSWLHGDRRGSVDRGSNGFTSPTLPRNDGLWAHMTIASSSGATLLHAPRRAAVDQSIRETCAAKDWHLYEVNVRTNHVHVVVSASERPEQVLTTLKAWATRRLRELGFAGPDAKVWTRHGSTRRVWTEESLANVVHYVAVGQDDGDLMAEKQRLSTMSALP